MSVADPGFPMGGGVDPLGGVDLRHRRFSAKMYAKMKELGPIGGRAIVEAHRIGNGHRRPLVIRFGNFNSKKQ